MLNVNNYALHEIVRPVIAIVPASKSDGSTTNGNVISLKGVGKLGVMVEGGAGGTLTITMQQCTAVAGTAAKALTTPTECWIGNNSADNLTRTSLVSTPGTMTLLPSTFGIINIDPSQLDIANGFDCVRVVAVVAGTIVIDAKYWLANARYNSDTANLDATTD